MGVGQVEVRGVPAGAAVVAAAESPLEALSPSSDPQAAAIRVNAKPRAINTRRFRRMVPSMFVE